MSRWTSYTPEKVPEPVGTGEGVVFFPVGVSVDPGAGSPISVLGAGNMTPEYAAALAESLTAAIRYVGRTRDKSAG